jgi:hypothetical protein
MLRAEVKIGGPQKNFRTLKKIFGPSKFFFSDFWAEIAPSSVKMAPPFSPFFRGGGANGGILLRFAPLLLHHYGPRPRWPPPCYGPADEGPYLERYYFS